MCTSCSPFSRDDVEENVKMTWAAAVLKMKKKKNCKKYAEISWSMLKCFEFATFFGVLKS